MVDIGEKVKNGTIVLDLNLADHVEVQKIISSNVRLANIYAHSAESSKNPNQTSHRGRWMQQLPKCTLKWTRRTHSDKNVRRKSYAYAIHS